MNTSRFLRIGAILLILAGVSPIRAAGGDAEWQKVAKVIESIRNPQERPKTRDEAIANLKKGLTEFDAAKAAAMKADPTNPARWDAALFELTSVRGRQITGVPVPEKIPTLADILQAADAKPETKSRASAMSVMEAAAALDAPGSDTSAWIAKAEKHLKEFPEERMNALVESKIASVKSTAELKTKPLELKFTAIDGREVDISKLRGKVVLIDFWATWCGPCVGEIPNVIKAYKSLHPKGFEIVGISLDSDRNKLESFVKEQGMEWPQYFDGKGWSNQISTGYGIHSIPAMWLLDKKGLLVSTNARGELEEKVTKLLAE